MTKIYRVEHKTNPLLGVCDMLADHFYHWGRIAAPNYQMKRKHVCGTSSKKKLKYWFRKSTLKALDNTKFHVVVLEVPSIAYFDSTQVVFIRESATVLQTLDLLSFN